MPPIVTLPVTNPVVGTNGTDDGISPTSPTPGTPLGVDPADSFARTHGTGSLPAGSTLPKRLTAPKMAAKILEKLDLRPDPYSHYQERLAKRVQNLSGRLSMATSAALEAKGPQARLAARYPDARVDIVAVASAFEHESIQYWVRIPGQKKPRRFVVTPKGELFEDREASTSVIGRVRFKDGKASFTPVAPRRTPMFGAPPWAPGREVDVPIKNEIHSGKLVGMDEEGRWTIELTTADGKKRLETLEQYQVVTFNNPHEFALHGSRCNEIELNVDEDATLREFLDEAIAIGEGILAAASDGPARVEAEKEVIAALLAHVESHFQYPSTPEWGSGDIPADDPRSLRYNELMERAESAYSTIPFGELIAVRAGVCRHRALAMQCCLQVVGIDSRLTSGGAYTAEGVYRGPHAWLETMLADGSRYLTDAQWGDPHLPLKDTYENDARRREIPDNTEHYSVHVIS